MNILYFAWVREKVGAAEETVSPPSTVSTLEQLIDWLAQRSPRHAAAFADRKLIRAAIDQVHCQVTASVTGAKEVAFFPPVTGG